MRSDQHLAPPVATGGQQQQGPAQQPVCAMYARRTLIECKSSTFQFLHELMDSKLCYITIMAGSAA